MQAVSANRPEDLAQPVFGQRPFRFIIENYEVVGRLMMTNAGDSGAGRFDGSPDGPAQTLSKNLFDRVQIWQAFWQQNSLAPVEQMSWPMILSGWLPGLSMMTMSSCRGVGAGGEAFAIDWGVEEPGCCDAVVA